MAKKPKNPVITVAIGSKVLDNVEVVNAGPKTDRFVHLSSRTPGRWQLLHSDIALFRDMDKNLCVTIVRDNHDGVDTRTLDVVGTGVKAALSIVTRLRLPNNKFIHLDEIPGGTWRLSYSTAVIDDTHKVISFNFLVSDPEDTSGGTDEHKKGIVKT